jgi:hypothetical protein
LGGCRYVDNHVVPVDRHQQMQYTRKTAYESWKAVGVSTTILSLEPNVNARQTNERWETYDGFCAWEVDPTSTAISFLFPNVSASKRTRDEKLTTGFVRQPYYYCFWASA